MLLLGPDASGAKAPTLFELNCSVWFLHDRRGLLAQATPITLDMFLFLFRLGTALAVSSFLPRGNVIGPFFTHEVMTAFFLEAGFIGIMLFGMDRVSNLVHFVSCLMVALGALFSAFWILAANSWMQTPAGFTIADGQFHVADWASAIFNPSFPYRFARMVTAAYIAGTFVVIGVQGFYLWRGQHREFAAAGFSPVMWLALILTPLQMLRGDMHGRTGCANWAASCPRSFRPGRQKTPETSQATTMAVAQISHGLLRVVAQLVQISPNAMKMPWQC
jgi:hypothetical protein